MTLGAGPSGLFLLSSPHRTVKGVHHPRPGGACFCERSLCRAVFLLPPFLGVVCLLPRPSFGSCLLLLCLVSFRSCLRPPEVRPPFFPYLEGDLPEQYLYPLHLPLCRGFGRWLQGGLYPLIIFTRLLDPVPVLYPPCLLIPVRFQGDGVLPVLSTDAHLLL